VMQKGPGDARAFSCHRNSMTNSMYSIGHLVR